jgi:hypothetical protein
MGLPTSGWQAGIWVAIALGAWPLARAVWPRLAARVAVQAEIIESLAVWAHALGPTYLALITGTVTGRDLGVYGPGLAEWASSAIAVAVALGAAELGFRFRNLAIDTDSPLTVALDETRWGLYRAAGIGWVGSLWSGLAIGLVLAAADWGLKTRAWRAEARHRTDVWPWLMRAGLSAGLFAATRNLWLMIACQVCLAAMARRRS